MGEQLIELITREDENNKNKNTYSSIFVHKRAEHRISEKGLVRGQLEEAFFLSTQKFPDKTQKLVILFPSKKQQKLVIAKEKKWKMQKHVNELLDSKGIYLKYELSKIRGFEVQAPSKPDRSLWHLPCAEYNKTRLKEIRQKWTSRL